MSEHPSPFRLLPLATVAFASAALTGCVIANPPRPGVGYGYVGGAYGAEAAPGYYDGYGYSYGDAYYGTQGYYSSYYGYYGPSTTFVYTYDRSYARPSPGNGNDRSHEGAQGGHHDAGHDGGGSHAGGPPGGPGSRGPTNRPEVRAGNSGAHRVDTAPVVAGRLDDARAAGSLHGADSARPPNRLDTKGFPDPLVI
ncbi:MAG: hypothetical protein QM661_05635 [Solimonas sp.]